MLVKGCRLWSLEFPNWLHGERVWLAGCCFSCALRRWDCRPSDFGDELVANGLSRNGSLVPAKPAVEVPLLKLLADVVDGDVLRTFRPPHLLGDDDGPHLFVSQFDGTHSTSATTSDA